MSIMMFVLSEILLWYQNSDKVVLGKQNCKQSFDWKGRERCNERVLKFCL